MNRGQRRHNGNKRVNTDRGVPSELTLEQFFGPNKDTWPKDKGERELLHHKASHISDGLADQFTEGQAIAITPFWDDCAKCLFDKDIKAGISIEEATKRQYKRAGLPGWEDYEID